MHADADLSIERTAKRMASKPLYGLILPEGGTYLVERDVPDIPTAQRTLFPIQRMIPTKSGIS